MKNSKHVSRLAVVASALVLACDVSGAPVTPTDESIDAKSTSTSGHGTVGAYREGSKSTRREDAKTIDLLIELQDKGGNAPVGLNHATSTVDEARAAATKRATANKAAAHGPDAGAFFAVKPPVGGTATSTGAANSDWKPPESGRAGNADGSAKGDRSAASESWLLGLLPRELFRWARENRYLVLGGALAAACVGWVASAALSQRRS
jgi:hypothetical protein